MSPINSITAPLGHRRALLVGFLGLSREVHMRKISSIAGLLILTLLIMSVTGTGFAQECRLYKFPCFITWTTTLNPSYPQNHEVFVSKSSIGVTADTNLLVPTVAYGYLQTEPPSISEVTRSIYRLKADGSEVRTPSGRPWFSMPANDTYSISWQRIAVDNERKRVFVLLATHRTESDPSRAYTWWLAAHDLQTGEKLAGWGVTTRQIGESGTLNAGLDIDSLGNPWTVLEVTDRDQYGVSQVGLQIRAWDGNNGHNVTSTITTSHADTIWLASEQSNTDRRFVGFGIRKNDSKMYVAFSETNQTDVTRDLVVTLWDSSFRLLDKKEINEELPPPTVLPSQLEGYATAHPVFTDGLVDEDGNISVGGKYVFLRHMDAFDAHLAFPTLLRFAVSASGDKLDVKFDYREAVRYYGDNYDGRVQLASGSDGSTWIGALGPESAPIYVVEASGQLSSFTYLTMPYTWYAVEDPQGSGCYYSAINYISSFAANHGQPVLSGEAIRRLVQPSPSGCRGQQFWGFLAGYDNRIRIVCCVLVPFEWRSSQYPRYLGTALWNRLLGTTASEPASERNWTDGALLMEPAPNASRKGVRYNLMPTLRHASILTGYSRLPEFGGGLVEQLIGELERAPLGFIFDKSLQSSTVKALRQVRTSDQLTSATRSKVVEAANALALDQQVEALSASRTMVATGGRPAVGRVTWMNAAKSVQPGTLSISVRNGLPALAKGFEPAWPLAIYHFEFTGKVSEKDPIVIRFSVSEFGFAQEVQSFHLLQWDGSSYRDITDSFDAQKRQITAKIARPSDVVLMGLSTAIDPKMGSH